MDALQILLDDDGDIVVDISLVAAIGWWSWQQLTSSTRTMSFMCWSDSRSNFADLQHTNANYRLQCAVP